MDIAIVLALAAAVVLCFLPGVMAWIHYFGGRKQAARKSKTVGATRPVTTGHAY